MVGGSGCLEGNMHSQNDKIEHLYILQAWSTDYYKIGYTTGKVSERINQLSTGNPFYIVPLGIYVCEDAKQAERYLHDKFKNRKIRGEWFLFSKDDLKSELYKTADKMGRHCPCVIHEMRLAFIRLNQDVKRRTEQIIEASRP